MSKRLVVIDGKSVFYRGYYAMSHLSMKDGTPTGGVYGFTALSLEIMKKLKPDYVAVAWDKAKTNIRKRREIYPEYKAGRKPAPPDFYEQIPMLYELLEAFSWPLYELDDFEADDIMGSLARQASQQGIETCLITSDLDLLQAISPKTHVYALKKGFSNIELFHPESFQKKYNIDVHQFLDLKALKGDSSDNLPGVPGVGEKTAVQLLGDFKTLDGVYEHLDNLKPVLKKKLEAGKDSAYITKEVARLWVDAPIPLNLNSTNAHDVDVIKVKKLLEKFEFQSLLKQLPEHMQVDSTMKKQERIPQEDIKRLTKSDEGLFKEKNTLAVAITEGKWLISSSSEYIFYTDLATAARLMADKSIIAHDARLILIQLLENGSNLPEVKHDTRLGAFMLDSLIRSRELDELSGIDLEDDNGTETLQAIWKLYAEQTASFKKVPKLASLARDIDFKLIQTLVLMEHEGIKLDVELLSAMSKEFDIKISRLREEAYEMVGYEFNLSSPAQLANVLFETLALPTQGIKKGKTGYSTGAKELAKLKHQHPIIECIENYRELTKLQNTYIDSLPKLVDEKNQLHTTFKQDVAATGRLSSVDPNLQNIPIRTELGRKIRDAFIPAKGNVFVSADYSQFELRLAAVLAGDKQMIEDFNSDMDIHTKTASDVYKIPLSEITKAQRRDAKVINFGVLYGMSPHGLSAATGMTFGDAKKFIDNYFHLRIPIRNYIDTTLEKAKTEGYVETLFGRRRPTPDVNSSNFMVREGAKRAAANMPIQGTEADLMKMAMIEVDKKLGDLGWQVLQIHDSILIECPEKNAQKVSKILQETMETIYPKLGIKLKVDVSIGKNWGEL